jgi:hypothetical protein
VNRQDLACAAVYVCVAVALGFVDHRIRPERTRHHVVSEYVPSVIAGTSGAPAKYRILMPYTLDRVTRATSADPYIVFLLAEFTTITASLFAVHAFIRRWYSTGASLAGTIALAALLPLTFVNTWAHPDSFPELTIFALGSLAVAARRDLLLAAILAVGMFNRETTGFLVLLWAVHRLAEDRSAKTLTTLALLVGLAGGIYLGLRWARGFEQYGMWMLPENLRMLRLLPPGFDPYTRIAGYFWLVLLGVPGWLAVRGSLYPGSPRFFRSTLPVAGSLILVAWTLAAIIEARVLIPVLPLLLPGAMRYFVDIRPDSPDSSPVASR